MLSRFSRYPGGKILGFGSPTQMQKRNYYDTEIAISFGIWICIFTLPPPTIYLAYKYFHNNYEIVRKNKKDDKNLNLIEKNIPEKLQPMRRPGM